ncbi:MAG: alpha/beta hydrolase-fold protein [Gemmatimonadota bacterium]|nr:alpha/beta hydrolase-fold protein [Gemmatimonadota bacterium]
MARFTGVEMVGETSMPSSPAVEALRERVGSDPGAVEEFVSGHELPLAEPPLYTFVYRGAADAVRLRHWIFGLPSSQPFARLPGTDLWYRTVEIPDDSRLEYKIEVLQGGGARWIEDPFNDARARDPFGANSVLAARGYEVPSWGTPNPSVPAGSFDEVVLESEVFGETRHFPVYRPARFRETRRYPLLVVYDGPDYLEYANLAAVLDNLTHALEIPGMIVACVGAGDRMREYTGDERHARYVVEEVIPRLEDSYPLIEGAQARGLAGASLGAVAAFDVARRYPDRFGRLLLQSGSFAFTDIGESERGPAFEPIVEMMNDYRADPFRLAAKAFVSVGVYESLVWENRALIPVLRRTGMEVQFVEARDGHNWENWRDRLRAGLSWLFPGPLWMVYE